MGWKVTLAAVALSLCALAVAVAPIAASTTGSCRGAISWSRASRYIGRVETVKGPVAGAFYARSTNGSPTFLDLGADYPNPRRFTVLIWGRDRNKFRSPENTYLGRTICVRGLIRLYRGGAEVFASSPSQIAIA